MTNKITVMVTGIGGGGHGEQILKALRLADTPYEIVGSDMSQFCRGFKEVDHSYVVPPARDPQYINRILELCLKHRVQALFHGSEPELMVLSRNRKVFEAQGIFVPINPQRVIDLCMCKSSTIAFLQEHKFSYPYTLVLSKLEDIQNWKSFPAILKPSIGSGGSAHTFIAQNKAELEILARYLLDLQVCPEVIVQEYKGTPEAEFTVGVLSDMDGNLINSIALRRNLSSSLSCRIRIPNRTGFEEFGKYLAVSTGVSQGEIGKFPEVTKTCERISSRLGVRGAVNIQCRLHRGEVYVFEINPRFSGTTSLRAMVGYNEPDLLIRRHVLGEEIPRQFSFRRAMIVRGLDETLYPIQDDTRS
jgi:carbamoyl-phosphate synthase large subunit